MCRWAAYRGPEIYLEDIISRPSRSLLAQSRNAHEAKAETNGDGFGLVWYSARAEPGHYREVLPAWSDENLKSLVRQIRSGLFLAHVRASTGPATNRANCHPFVAKRFAFMHNGQIGAYETVRRRLDMRLTDLAYRHRAGTTDSEALFLLAYGDNLENDPKGAMQRAIGLAEELARDDGRDPKLRFTVAYSDGGKIYAIRYATDDRAPTLYYRKSGGGGGTILASEPLDDQRSKWELLPPASFVTLDDEGIFIEPFAPLCANRIAA